MKKGSSPVQGDFNKYEDAKNDLVSRLGTYCSYCERRVSTNLAVEHLEPKKGAFAKPELEKRWSNFLLACVNCNSTKGDKQVDFASLFFPDRDNTFHAFNYLPDGTVEPAEALPDEAKLIAQDTLELLGLDKPKQADIDHSGNQVALDRVSQRMSAWANAEASKKLLNDSDSPQLRAFIAATTATSVGYFSVWMTVFKNDNDMKLRLIQAFKGTAVSGCFDMTTGNSITPAPNPDLLQNGGKI